MSSPANARVGQADSLISMQLCRVCDWTGSAERFAVREMMFGWRDSFDYFECPECGCLQIAAVPDDLGRYYPAAYRAFALSDRPNSPKARVKELLRRQLALSELGRTTPIGALLKTIIRRNILPRWLQYSREMLKLNSRILDVGSGSGQSLSELARFGFTDLTGVDPFIPESVTRSGYEVLKQDLTAMRGSFEFVMLHHVLEHMPSPRAAFGELGRLLHPSGWLLVRVPVARCVAWQRYRTDWVQIDAPRHLVLYTKRSLESLAATAGLVLVKTVFDSTGFQFWGSEQYCRDIPLEDSRSVWRSPPHGIFTADEMQRFEAEAAALNGTGEGDQAAFFFRHRDAVQ